MLKLIKCEFLKLKRKPLVFISLLLSVFMPLAYAFFLADVNTDVDAVNGVMSSLFQLSAYLLLMPLLVILASNLLFEELDNDTLKNLVTVPVNRTKLVLSKMLVLLLFAVGFIPKPKRQNCLQRCAPVRCVSCLVRPRNLVLVQTFRTD